ncbi:rhodanese-like domain-containing protein [Alishewanella sp. 16-MA]|uniref:Rhodanese-like domain-containing protein n=1 Tax=Alishewanella maricola TaxID=2795740 RepID=A0ABS8C6N2_9ALTE|nr:MULTISPECIES: rhodanese-like domain-containing protein [Alishewanella]MDP4945945.1 rhodanese-like domain-containing protein [Alishewanella sp.]MCB5227989.1 rhodanese-like domain-containing protein [Alishewanella maricola]MDP5034776.1 rhodanese-like domain-containing protein [Alishewanella sp.]MDP5186508.1 rhodanese-like domain-containing protein [Alishewanella sp.]MDP5459816.1 rhodanese-like domain-containing protein [Alishewanella sp. SMS8]
MKTAQQLVAEAKERIKEVDIQQLAAQLEKQPSTRIIDVREPAEFAQAHISSVVNYPRGVLEMQLANHPAVAASGCAAELALAQLAQEPLYLICRSGARSALAAESLQNMGFTDVYSVAGGMAAWQEAGLPVTQ